MILVSVEIHQRWKISVKVIKQTDVYGSLVYLMLTMYDLHLVRNLQKENPKEKITKSPSRMSNMMPCCTAVRRFRPERELYLRADNPTYITCGVKEATICCHVFYWWFLQGPSASSLRRALSRVLHYPPTITQQPTANNTFVAHTSSYHDSSFRKE